MATDTDDSDETPAPPTTRFLSANGNLVRYDFDAPEPPEQRVVAVEGDTAHVVAVVREGCSSDALEDVLADLATELSYAADENVEVDGR